MIFTLRPGDIRRYQACARRGKAPTHTLVQQGPSIVRPVQGEKRAAVSGSEGLSVYREVFPF